MSAITPAYAQEEISNPQPFAQWLENFKEEAASQGVSHATLTDAFEDTDAPIDRIIELDRKQPETRLTLKEYLDKTVTPSRIQNGRERSEQHQEVLEKISKQYAVQSKYILALWGVETGYGTNTGGFSVIDALATLAYDGRRNSYFRSELIKALKIIDQEHIPAASMQGSWAGAMGQCQFMPTSFLEYAVDYDGDGKRDIWNSEEDVFASIANYLSISGWLGDEGWGMRVMLPFGFDTSLADIGQSKHYNDWQHLGVRRANGNDLPQETEVVSLILVGDGDDAVPYLITSNYKILLKWNRSRYFATAVGKLADSIGEDD